MNADERANAPALDELQGINDEPNDKNSNAPSESSEGLKNVESKNKVSNVDVHASMQQSQQRIQRLYQVS